MRILQIVQELGVGGAERVVLSLAAAAPARGDDLAVVAAPGPLADGLGCRIYPLPMLRRRPERLPRAALAVVRAIRDFRPDVVHCHNPAMAAVASVPTGRGRRVPALVSVHGVPDEDYRAAARTLRLSGIPAVACGPGVAMALQRAGLAVDSTVVNGIAWPPPPPADRRRLLDEWGLPPDTALVVAVGRLVAQKNHAAAVRALAGVPGASLVVVGSGPRRADVIQAAHDAGVASRVVLPGPRADARSVMAAADVVVLPSRWEGLPLVGLEALAARTPLVAADVVGIRELFEDGVHCLLTDPEQPDAFAAAIRRVLDEGALRERLVDNGATLVSEYTEEAMVGRFWDRYASLAAGRDGMG